MPLAQFFQMRTIPVHGRSYPAMKGLQYWRYISLFDDYWVKTDELDYERTHTYSFFDDPVVMRTLLYVSGAGGLYSPNLSIQTPGFSLFWTQGGRRFLLQEYAKDLANVKKRLGVPYEIRIIKDVPFLCVPLQEGNYYPLSTLMPKSLALEEKKQLLLKADQTFTGDNFMEEHCYIYVPRRSALVMPADTEKDADSPDREAVQDNPVLQKDMDMYAEYHPVLEPAEVSQRGMVRYL